MKKLNKKQIKILIVLIIVILLIALGVATFYFIKKLNSKKTMQTASMQEEVFQDEEIEESTEEIEEIEDNSEESIENLPEEDIGSLDKTNKDKAKTDTVNNTNKYYIKVNYGANVVTVYTKDKEGKYTVPVKAMLCSTGASTPKSGTYPIQGRWRWLNLFGGVKGQYSTRIVGHILFHSVPYLKKSPDSLEYWEYDKLGTSCSMGCIRLVVKDAKWIYDNVTNGTLVEFYSSKNPGPLRKTICSKNI